jgi:hypothetical protein
MEFKFGFKVQARRSELGCSCDGSKQGDQAACPISAFLCLLALGHDFTVHIKQVVTCFDLENPGFILAIGLRLCEITEGKKTLGIIIIYLLFIYLFLESVYLAHAPGSLWLWPVSCSCDPGSWALGCLGLSRADQASWARAQHGPPLVDNTERKTGERRGAGKRRFMY